MTSSESTQLNPSYSPDTCMFCNQSLCIIAEPEDFPNDDDDFNDSFEPGPSEMTVIDDVELYCGPPGSGSGSGPSGHHAHWTCLIEHARQVRTQAAATVTSESESRSERDSDLRTVARCVVCGENTLDASGRFVVDVRNEGGETRGFDFGEILEEELFLDTHPDQLHSRAFHDLIAQGDYGGAIELMTRYNLDVNCTYGMDGLTAMQKAMFSGDVNGVEFLKGLGARG